MQEKEKMKIWNQKKYGDKKTQGDKDTEEVSTKKGRIRMRQ
jgi:hypothetical protein